ncbi:MAG: hypothetical protein VR73_07325 [Gammaproteobacteria bacterium BRH_c0]|nr:MAG: hypothetical protein VR73_07325 [Gammaproteobacteria bacterium BRH_c0]
MPTPVNAVEADAKKKPRSDEKVELDINGVGATLSRNIRAHLGLDSISCRVSEARLRSHLRGADEKISEGLRALGYYNGSWHLEHSAITRETRNGDIDCWQIDLTVEAGKPVLVENRDVQVTGAGATDPVFTDFLTQLPLAPGQRLRHNLYEDIKKGLSQRARNHGYFDGEFDQHILRVNTETQRTDITIHYDSGPRYRFGELTFAESPLDNDLLRRYLTFQPGDPYDAGKLIQFQNNLVNSQYFDSVSVDQTQRDQDDKVMPISVVVSAKSKYETTAGVGFSTDTGPRLSYGLRNRRVNSAGDTYQISSQLSPVDSNLGFQYEQPGDKPLREKTQWSTGWQREDTDTATSDSLRAEVARIAVSDSGWMRTISLKYLFERFDIADDKESSMLLMPGIGWSRSSANDPRYPTRGWRLATNLRGAVEGVVSDISMAQAEIDGKLILPLLGGRMLTRAGLAATALDDFSQLPASLRYFAGGDNSVRGFDYESLGPTNSEGEVIGGKHRITASVEYDHRVFGDFALATFYDAGNAFDTTDFTLQHSAGVGVRWLSPIGPIRVDFAFPLKEGGFRFHLSMGPDL